MKKLIFLFIALSLNACVSLHVPIDQKTRSSIQEVEVYSVVIQDEISPAVKVASSTNTGNAIGGLLGMAIAANVDAAKNKARNRSAAELIEPFWNATLDVDYRSLAAPKVNSAVEKLFDPGNPDERSAYAVYSKEELREHVQALKPNSALVYIVHDYGFVDDYQRLRTGVRVLVYEPKSASESSVKPAYMRNFLYESGNVGSGNQNSIDLWLADDARLYKDKLGEGLDNILEIVVYDIGGQGDSCKTKGSVDAEVAPSYKTMPVKGTLWRVSDTFSVVETSNGIVYASEKSPNPPQPSC